MICEKRCWRSEYAPQSALSVYSCMLLRVLRSHVYVCVRVESELWMHGGNMFLGMENFLGQCYKHIQAYINCVSLQWTYTAFIMVEKGERTAGPEFIYLYARPRMHLAAAAFSHTIVMMIFRDSINLACNKDTYKMGSHNRLTTNPLLSIHTFAVACRIAQRTSGQCVCASVQSCAGVAFASNPLPPLSFPPHPTVPACR